MIILFYLFGRNENEKIQFKIVDFFWVCWLNRKTTKIVDTGQMVNKMKKMLIEKNKNFEIEINVNKTMKKLIVNRKQKS